MSATAHLAAMNRQYIEEHHVLMRYLAGQLSDSEREAFEAYYVEHPHMLQELEVAAKLKLGLTLLNDTGELAQPKRTYWLPKLAAAAILLVVISGALWLTRPAPVPLLLAASVGAFGELRSAPLLADTHTIERTRSRNVDASFELPAVPRVICLRVLPEHAASTYSLRLNRVADGAAPYEIGELRALRRDTADLITVYVDSTRLQPGKYEIVLTAESAVVNATNPASSFSILIQPPSPR